MLRPPPHATLTYTRFPNTTLFRAPDLPRRRTCLEGLDELGGGERLSDVAGCRTIDTPWSIWDFAAPDKRLTDGREAILRVRDAVQTAVAAGASAYETVVLRLSGGLDSSIVAACLAQADRRESGRAHV